MKNKILVVAVMCAISLGLLVSTSKVFSQVQDSGLLTRRVGQRVYQGVFDINQPGDLIIESDNGPHGIYYHHWKEIRIPEIRENKMPSVMVYARFFEQFRGRPNNKKEWVTSVFQNPNQPSIQNGKVFIHYKTVLGEGNVHYSIDGNYKIVVTY
ncbi:MAG: hypothetical protein KGZ97_01340 [Bacteroidetes bacterium]|nr:hypothetical protein [Bacteroidota bacterium]